CRSTPSTSPPGPTRWASSAVVQPEPAPRSSTRFPSRTSSRRSMSATVVGCELVCPSPIGSGASCPARCLCEAGRKRARGTASIACATRSAGSAPSAGSALSCPCLIVLLLPRSSGRADLDDAVGRPVTHLGALGGEVRGLAQEDRPAGVAGDRVVHRQ